MSAVFRKQTAAEVGESVAPVADRWLLFAVFHTQPLFSPAESVVAIAALLLSECVKFGLVRGFPAEKSP